MEVLNVRTIHLSYTELEITSRFWDLYTELRGQEPPNNPEELQRKCDTTLAQLSDETREVILTALDQFELEVVEFQVRIAPDDANLVRQ